MSLLDKVNSAFRFQRLGVREMWLRAALLGGLSGFTVSMATLTPIAPMFLIIVLVVGLVVCRIPWKFLEKNVSVRAGWSFFVMVGAVAISLLAFKPRSLRPYVLRRLLVDPDRPWENWHVAALFWTFVVGFYSAYKFVSALVRPGGGTKQAAHVLQLIFAFFALLVILAVFPFEGLNPIIQAFVIAGLFCAIDGAVWVGLGGGSGKGASVRERNELRRAGQTLILADIPAFVAFGMLYLWMTLQETRELPLQSFMYGAISLDLPLQSFMYGAISFQLLASKGIFMLIEGGVLDDPFGKTPPKPPGPDGHGQTGEELSPPPPPVHKITHAGAG
jgi:hypothetical protein